MRYVKKTTNPRMGRPIAKNPLNHDLKVRLDAETFASLEAYCEMAGTNKAETVRSIVQDFLKKKK